MAGSVGSTCAGKQIGEGCSGRKKSGGAYGGAAARGKAAWQPYRRRQRLRTAATRADSDGGMLDRGAALRYGGKVGEASDLGGRGRLVRQGDGRRRTAGRDDGFITAPTVSGSAAPLGQ